MIVNLNTKVKLYNDSVIKEKTSENLLWIC